MKKSIKHIVLSLVLSFVWGQGYSQIDTLDRIINLKIKIDSLNEVISSRQQNLTELQNSIQEVQKKIDQIPKGDIASLKKQRKELEQEKNKESNLVAQSKNALYDLRWKLAVKDHLRDYYVDHKTIESQNKERISSLDESILKTKNEIKALHKKIRDAALLEREKIEELSKKTANLKHLSYSALQTSVPELEGEAKRLSLYIVGTNEIESSIKKIAIYQSEIKIIEDAKRLLLQAYNADKISAQITRLNSVKGANEGIKKEKLQVIELLSAYCERHNATAKSIRKCNLILFLDEEKIAELDSTMKIMSDYPYLVEVLKAKKKDLKSEENPLSKVTCK